jgi:hypothetical protein
MPAILFQFSTATSRRAIQCCIWIALLLAPDSLFAQEKSLRLDSSAIAPRIPDNKWIEQLKKDSDYNYLPAPKPESNFFDRWMSWIKRRFIDLLTSKSYHSFWQYVIMASVAALVVFLLYKAKILNFVFPPAKDGDTLSYHIEKEDIHQINFDEAISKALLNSDFRLAIRLQYLKTLKILADSSLIQWTSHLTNQSYIQQLNRSPLGSDFEKITRYFEFAWYGGFPIRKEEFEEMKDWSNSFYQKIERR